MLSNADMSAIGGNDGVSVKLPVAILARPRRVSLTACINNRCRRATYDRFDKRFPTGFVVMPVPKDTTVQLRVPITPGRGEARARAWSTRNPIRRTVPLPADCWVAAADVTQARQARGGDQIERNRMCRRWCVSADERLIDNGPWTTA